MRMQSVEDIQSILSSHQAHPEFRTLIDSWRSPRTDLELAEFLRQACSVSSSASQALEALEAAAPFAERLAQDATKEVLQHLEQLCHKIAEGVDDLPAHGIVSALRACAEAGLPYAPLCSVALASLGADLRAAQSVEVLESCAALRLEIPQLRPWLSLLLEKGLERQLSAGGLARLLAAAGRLGLLEAHETAEILHRIVTVASPLRPLAAEALAALSLGLALLRWKPSDGRAADFWQVACWIGQLDRSHVQPGHIFALRSFALWLLVSPENRVAVNELRPDLQRAIAKLVRENSTQHRPVSDTTLKFRHEAAEVLRRANQPYDLDISLGLGFVDLALPGADGVFWLLDGPEAFRRPFRTDAGRPQLHLVATSVVGSAPVSTHNKLHGSVNGPTPVVYPLLLVVLPYRTPTATPILEPG
eukprot:g15591.t1